MKRLIKNKSILQVLRACNPKLRKSIVQNMSNDVVKTIAEIAKNTLNGFTKIADTKFHQQLKKYKTSLRILASRNTSLTVKRRLILSSGRLIVFLLESIFNGAINEDILKESV